MDLTERQIQIENQELQYYLLVLKEKNQEIKSRLSVFIYENQLEQEIIKFQIKKLQTQICQLKNEIALYEPSQEANDLEIDENGEIKGGTVEKLIDCLYFDYGSKVTTEYVKVFLLTYRSFTSPNQVIEHLMKCYNKFITDSANAETWKPCRLRIGNFLRKWITENSFDFSKDVELQKQYLYFTSIIAQSDSKLSDVINSTLSKVKNRTSTFRTSIFSSQAPTAHKTRSVSILTILDIHSQELARQITLIDYETCRAIEPKECLGMAWTKPDKEERSPNLMAMIKRFNSLSKYIAFLLVNEANLKRRVQFLSYIIDLLGYLYELNNFNSIFSIIAGLGNSAVFRMKKTFSLLSKEKLKILEDIRTLTAPEKSWANYRNKIHKINPPCIPFLGVYQTDLTFIEEGNPSKLSNGFINWKKCRLTASVITEIQQYQTVPYNLTIHQPVQTFYQNCLMEIETVDDKKLFDLSLIAEPRDN